MLIDNTVKKVDSYVGNGKAKNPDGLYCTILKRKYQVIPEVGSKVGTHKQDWLKVAYQTF